MVVHKFVCDDCAIIVHDTSAKDTHICPKCGKPMRWDVRGNWARAGDYYHISDSLAIHPDDAAEHRRKFPQVEVLPDGRLGFDSPKVQERYANKCGFEKKAQRGRKLGRKRIA